MTRLLLLFLLGIGVQVSAFAQFRIEGNLKADTSWAPIVYLSMIPTLEDMQTVSPDMIVMQSPVDTNGRFRFSGEYLPEGDHLYRLHMSKKGDPPSTIIIGGKEENHIFLIANPSMDCEINMSPDSSLWGKLNMDNCYLNSGIQEVNRILLEYESNASKDFSLGREFLQIARDEKLRRFADSSQHLLLALYALHHTHAKSHAKEEVAYYEDFFDKWANQESLYLDEFRKEVSLVPQVAQPDYLAWLVGFACLVLGMMIRPIFLWIKSQGQVSKEQLLKELSLQERKIFQLIREGKSNKEISEQLHIELTTVKSHVRNVYGKLQISSRKEALNIIVN